MVGPECSGGGRGDSGREWFAARPAASRVAFVEAREFARESETVLATPPHARQLALKSW